MTVLECRSTFDLCSIFSLQCVLFMKLLLLIPQLNVLAKASSARFHTNNVVNIFGIHEDEDLLYYRVSQKKGNDNFFDFGPSFGRFLTF